MTELSAAERNALDARLKEAVPAEPDLTGLVARSENGARRTRRRRRAGGLVTAVVAVTAVIVAPLLIGSEPVRDGARPPVGTHVPAHPCGGTPDHADFTQGTAAWVTFCPTRLSGRDEVLSLTPTGVLVSDAASLVAAWQASTGTAHSCPFAFGSTEFSVRVGFSDGTSTRIDGNTGPCQAAASPSKGYIGIASGGTVYSDLVRALGRQASSGHTRYDPPGPPPTCPPSPVSAGRLNVDGASAPGLHDSFFLLDMTAVEGQVCRYDGSGALIASGPAPGPEDLRIASGSSVMRSPFQRWRDAPATSYVVTLRDRTDTWRTFIVSGRRHTLTFFRGSSPGVAYRIGFAGEDLLLQVHEATR
jgi:hypothetical protein